MKKYVSILLIFLLAIFPFQSSAQDANSKEVDTSAVVSSNGNFKDDSVLIVLKDEYSKNGFSFELDDFPEIDCIGISDITKHISSLFKQQFDIIKTTDLTDVDQISVTKQILEKIDEKLKLVNVEKFNRVLSLKLETPSKENVLKAVQVLNKNDNVLYAEPDYIHYQAAVEPNDPELDEQWAIDALNLPEAWEILTGYNTTTIGIMDSGIDHGHEDFEWRISNITEEDFVYQSGTSDLTGHGTHVAGIIGAATNNATGIAGTNWNVEIRPLRVFNEEGKTYTSTLVAAIDYAEYFDIPLLNFSGGSYSADFDKTYYDHIEAYNGLLICSAGNGYDHDNDSSTANIIIDSDNNIKHYPSSFDLDNIISVGAHDKYNDWHYNYGKTSVDLAAPGISIYSTVPNDGYASWSGTSMATPYVTGVAALIMSLPNTNFTPAQVKSFILNGTDKVTAFADKCVTGGKLNAYRAVRNALEMGEGTTVAGDFNGDGTDEIAAFYGRNDFMALVYWENNGSKFNIQEGTVGCVSSAYAVSKIEGRVAALDYDGDGIDEIGALYDYGGYLGFWIFKLQSNGKFHPSRIGVTGSFPATVKDRVTSGDIDGDGREEVFLLYNYSGVMGWWIFKQNADGVFYHYCVGRTGTLNVDSIDGRVAGGDFDGDGRDEFGIMYDHTENYSEMMILDYSASGTFSYYTVGQTGPSYYGYMKGLISAGDYDGDGVDEMMGIYGYDQSTSNPYIKIWIFERDSSGGFIHYSSQAISQFLTAKIAGSMVTGDFNTASTRDTMAGIYQYGTFCNVWGFGRPSATSWYCKAMI